MLNASMSPAEKALVQFVNVVFTDIDELDKVGGAAEHIESAATG